MSDYHHYPPPHHSSRPRAPSYTGLPPSVSQHPKPLAHHTPTSTSPDAYTTPIPYAPHSRAPSISTSSLSSSSYAGSGLDASDSSEVDLIDVLTQRLSGAFDPLQLDRSLVVQAQTSGMLNGVTRELVALQEEAQRRLQETRRQFVEGMRVAKEVKQDLEYVSRRVKGLKERTERKYPVEYQMARERMPPPSQ